MTVWKRLDCTQGQKKIPRPPVCFSSSLRDFIVLVFNIEVFQIKFFLKIKSLKKKKKSPTCSTAHGVPQVEGNGRFGHDFSDVLAPEGRNGASHLVGNAPYIKTCLLTLYFKIIFRKFP